MKELDSLYTFISKYISIDQDVKERIGEVAVVRKYSASTSILNEGQNNRYFRFLCTGCVRFMQIMMVKMLLLG